MVRSGVRFVFDVLFLFVPDCLSNGYALVPPSTLFRLVGGVDNIRLSAQSVGLFLT